MKGKRCNTEQKTRIPRRTEEADATIVVACPEASISEQTFHRWKREFGMMKLDRAKQLKELQKQNARLKHMLADDSADCCAARTAEVFETELCLFYAGFATSTEKFSGIKI